MEKRHNSLFTKLIASHTLVVLLALLTIAFAADSFFRLFLVNEEANRLENNVSSVVRRVVVPGGPGGFVIRSERSILINTLQLAGIQAFDFPPSALEDLPLSSEEWQELQAHDQLFRKQPSGWFSLPELELYLVDRENQRVLLLKNPMTQAGETLSNMRRTFVYAGLIAIFITVFISFITSRYMVGPIRKIQEVARKVVQGDFRQRVRLQSYDELQDLAVTFNQTVDRVEETVREQVRLDELRKEFVSNVSHEFRVPLTSLAGFLELMEQGKIPEADKRKVTLMMQKDVNRLSRMVYELLDLSRLQAGKIELRREPVSIRAVTSDAVERLTPQIEKKQLHVTSSTIEPSLTAWADEDRLQQIILNLVGNAVQHTPFSETIRIEASLVNAGRDVEVTVTNTGTTIPSEALPHLWERFAKLDKARSQQGTGLGLAITRELVHLHGGIIQATNLPDHSGVRFSFTLPAQAFSQTYERINSQEEGGGSL